MPNWVYNTLSLTETKKGAMKGFLNATLKMSGYDVQVNSGQDWLDKVKNNQLCDNYIGIWLSTFVKIPETIYLYDTTNYPNGKGLVLGKKINIGEQEVVVTDEVIQSFKDATSEQLEKYGVVGWYDWNCKYLGCKWDTCLTEMDSYLPKENPEIDIIDEMECLTLKFDTPWSEPYPIYEFILHNFPDLELSIDVYEEMGHFGGSYSTAEIDGERKLIWTDDEEYYLNWGKDEDE